MADYPFRFVSLIRDASADDHASFPLTADAAETILWQSRPDLNPSARRDYARGSVLSMLAAVPTQKGGNARAFYRELYGQVSEIMPDDPVLEKIALARLNSTRKNAGIPLARVERNIRFEDEE